MVEHDHIAAVRDLATAVEQLAAGDVPELTVTDDMIVEESTDRDWIDVEQDEDWWSAWVRLCDIVDETMGMVDPAAGRTNMMRPDIDPSRRRMEIGAETEYTSLSVTVYASGDLGILAEYEPADGGAYDVLFEGRLSIDSVSGVDLGRQVSAFELAVLANETGSCADTLDYWMTAMHGLRQREWADIRGVGRQTVNDRVRSARTALESNE